MENKEGYSPKEIAEYFVIVSELKLSKYKLGMYDGEKEVKEMLAEDLLKKIERYKTKVPENIRNEIGLDTNKLEEICKE